ncbi:MAG: zinc-ribbon domain-containing protein [Bacteroidetes bacterium]|nr:zinc-ribbon domain-containing protein [Bacteroidota bacterium]
MHSFKNKTCPYCQSKIKDDLDVIVCSLCGTPHHRECYEENGGCTTYGCGNNPTTVKEERRRDGIDVGGLTVPAVQNLVNQSKLIECPNCRKEIEENSNYCKYCGYNVVEGKFDEENSNDENFEDEFKRKYEEKKKISRNTFILRSASIIFLFLFLVTTIYFAYSRISDYYNSDDYQIKSMVDEWKEAWEDKDINKYKTFFLQADYEYYGKDGKTKNYSERISDIKSTFDKYKYIKLNFSDFKIHRDSTSSNDLKVTFKQSYVSDKFEESGQKTLRLFKGNETGGKWKIYREIMD